MLFCTPQFAVFFAVVFTAYWLLPSPRGRVWLLLGASLYFYSCWNRWLALLLLATSTLDYLVALGMEATNSPRLRRLLLLASLVGNVGLLCYFKYANFFLRSLEEALTAMGATTSFPVLRVILPVGISFYTFEAINYTVDVYTRKIRPERRLSHFLLFILFFPHLVAGPIVRAKAFLPLIARPKTWSWLRASVGIRLILMGVFKKLAIADCMAVYVDPVFADPTHFATSALWLATIAYALQVYCDFSGYSDMAMGLAHLLGYHLAPNFNLPFLAVNMADFWRRWHMSLSSWIRDYLFIPLGGSRGTRWQTTRNILFTMSLCGLWHGANWNYVLWGFLNGVLLAGHAAFRPWCERQPSFAAGLRTPLGTVLRVALTFGCFCLTLAMFRSPGLAAGWETLGRLLIPTAGDGLTRNPAGLWATFLLVAVCHAFAARQHWLPLWEWPPAPIRGLGFGLAVALALILAPNASKAFIYFQF